MSNLMRFSLFIATCTGTTLLQTSCKGDPPSGHGSVEEFARKVLKAYGSKDVPKVFSMLSSSPPESVIAQVVPGSAPYEQLFGEDSREWQAVDSWNGDLGEVLLDQQAYIVIATQPSSFGPSNPDVLNCVRLKVESGKWLFDKFYIAQQAQVAGPEFKEMSPDSPLYNELNETTATIMAAYQQQDARTIKALSVEAGPWALRGESAESESERLFDPSEMAGVNQWQGTPGRVFIKSEAMVKFRETIKATHWLQLAEIDGQWKLKNIKIDSK